MTRLPLLFVLFALPLQAAAPATRQTDRIEQSIQRAKDFLYAKQKNGIWEASAKPPEKPTNNNVHATGQWGGLTALCTYALLAAGDKPSDPRLAPAIEFLKTADLRGTYAIALRCQVWLHLPPTVETKRLMDRDARLLLAATKGQGSATGLHDYTNSPKDDYSHSRAQYATLGLWAASQYGIEIPALYWQAAEAAWMRHQDPSGGWTYKALKETDHDLTPGMTAAGLATLFIIQDQLHAQRSLGCNGNVTSPGIERGIQWIAKNFDKVATDTRYPRDFHYATLYAVERVAVASGLKYFGTHDWYEKGSKWLLKTQKKDGSWASSGDASSLFAPIPDTCFGLLFLIRGRAPVVVSKLSYGLDGGKKVGHWNQRPRDVSSAVAWMGRQTEQFLNWQIVNLDAPHEDLMESPVMYVAGNQVLDFSDEQKAKLRRYVEEGGLILGNADCGHAGFANSFRKLGTELFPSYEFRELPADHSIYEGQQFSRKSWRQPPKLAGLSNGSRELMLLFATDDAARAWQTQAAGSKPELHQVFSNIVLYATDKEPKRKGDTHLVVADAKKKTSRTAPMARLAYGGNWNPEPAGWRRLAAMLRNEHDVTLVIDSLKLGEGELDPKVHKAAHLTGTTRFKLSPAQAAELKKYVEGGGLLLVDAAGGSPEFALSAEAELSGVAGGAPQFLAADHPFMKALGEVSYRTAARRLLGQAARGPRVKAVFAKDRPVVLFSAEDLSTGLVGHDVDGIVGYSPASAMKVVAAVILSTLPPAPATKPATPPAAKPAAKPAPAKK